MTDITLSAALALPAGPQLDALVCRKLGIQPVGTMRVSEYRGPETKWEPIYPAVSADIALCFSEVIPKMNDRGASLDLWQHEHEDGSIEGYGCEFIGRNNPTVSDCETPSLAICRAAMAACWGDET